MPVLSSEEFIKFQNMNPDLKIRESISRNTSIAFNHKDVTDVIQSNIGPDNYIGYLIIDNQIVASGFGIKESSNGKTVTVEDDFDLICWDFVSNPSTHGAFMRPMNESVVGKAKTPSYKKINTLVRDIICEIDGVCSI